MRDDLFCRPLRQQFAEGDIGKLVAALGLVHVMGGDQHGDALGGEAVDLVPEFAPRLGIDAGGRLVEQEQRGSGRMQAPSASRCFHPPDNSPASWSCRPASPSRAMARDAAPLGSRTP